MKEQLNFYQLVLFLGATLLFSATSCDSPKKENSTPFDIATAKKEIETQNMVFMNALLIGDSVGIANCYASDSKFMIPNSKAVVGRKNLIPIFSNFIKAGMTNFHIKIVDAWGNNDLLTVEQEWVFTDKNGKDIDRGKSLELWIKENGQWKLFRDCFNSDLSLTKM